MAFRKTFSWVLLGALAAAFASAPATAAVCSDKASCAFVDLLYDEIVSLFGNRDQMFTMEFPGRVIDIESYFYNVSDSSSQFLKPQAVAEAEFSLSDNMFGLSQIVGGPSGRLVSYQFEAALNSLIPKWMPLEFRKDQNAVREWLAQKVSVDRELMEGISDTNFKCNEDLFATKIKEPQDQPGQIKDGKDPQVTIIELHSLLIQRYEIAKLQWETCRLEHTQTVMEQPGLRDYFFRWLSVVGASARARIDAFWHDTVLQGYHDVVMSALGMIDINPPSVQLQKARDLLRSSTREAYSGGRVLPVTFQPANWASALTTQFTPEDLFEASDVVQRKIENLHSEIEFAIRRKILLETAMSQAGDIKKLEAQRDDARKAFLEAENELVDQYGGALIDIIKVFFVREKSNGSMIEEAIKKAIVKAGPKFQLTEDQMNALAKGFVETNKKQLEFDLAATRFSDLQAQLAVAHASDATVSIKNLELKIANLNRQLNNVVSLAAQASHPPKNESLLPSTQGSGSWTSVVLQREMKEHIFETKLTSASKSSSWKVGFIFGSASGSSSSSSGSNKHHMSEQNTNIEIGFQAMKVTMQRGEWFNPGLLASSGSLMRIVPGGVLSAPRPEDLQSPIPEDIVKNYDNATLPAFPVAFVIARDITVKLSQQNDMSDEQAEFAQEQAQAGGGIFCFSVSSSSSSSSSSAASRQSQDKKSIVIKIPGPQILGWFQEFVPEDHSAEYETMPDGYMPQLNKNVTEPGDDSRNRTDPEPSLPDEPTKNKTEARSAIKHLELGKPLL